MKIGILTVSDRVSRGEAEDRSGPVLVALVKEAKAAFGDAPEILTAVVPDDVPRVQETVKAWADVQGLNLVITTGGTGFAPRDTTPEAIRPLFHREAASIATLLTTESLKVTPLGALSRPVCGVRNSTMIVTFPGSPKACKECFGFILPLLPHALSLLSPAPADLAQVTQTHVAMQGGGGASQPVVVVPKQHQHQHSCCPHHHHGHGHGHDQGSSQSGQAQSMPPRREKGSVANRPRQSPYPMLPMDEAFQVVLKQCAVKEAEEIPLYEALGRVLAEDFVSPEVFPPFPASVKDGYAVIASDGAAELTVLGPVTAGQLPSATVTPGTTMRITTGAPLPPGADAVVQVEDTELLEVTEDGMEEKRIRILVAPKQGQDIRPIGSDISLGELIVSKGTKIGSAEIGLLASLGCTRVKVHSEPTVALLSTGDELVENGSAQMAYGQIRDSNRPMLLAALAERRVRGVVDLGIVGDQEGSLRDKLLKGIEQDILITSGGVSMGEKDLLKDTIRELGGHIHFGRVHMKPGKPTTFATVPKPSGRGTCLVFSLPGNPVSCVVTFHLFVSIAVDAMRGLGHAAPATITAVLADDARLDPRPEYHRVFLIHSEKDTLPKAISTGSQCSSRLLSARAANGLLVLPAWTPERTVVRAGEHVKVIPL